MVWSPRARLRGLRRLPCRRGGGALNWTGTPLWAKFFFQLVFAGTAATIVSGAVAERIKFAAFFLFSFMMVGFVYPFAGHWIWGGGWLSKLGMLDFAGSTAVHSIGGWAAFAGILMLGPRIGMTFEMPSPASPQPMIPAVSLPMTRATVSPIAAPALDGEAIRPP